MRKRETQKDRTSYLRLMAGCISSTFPNMVRVSACFLHLLEHGFATLDNPWLQTRFPSLLRESEDSVTPTLSLSLCVSVSLFLRVHFLCLLSLSQFLASFLASFLPSLLFLVCLSLSVFCPSVLLLLYHGWGHHCPNPNIAMRCDLN